MKSGYELSRNWFDWAFENPDKATANHTALYLWLCEINNRCGWSEKFQITANECMNGMSCKSYKTYRKCLTDLIDWQFVVLVKQSVNQHQCNVIAIVKNAKATTKALTKAMLKHNPKQDQRTYQSTTHILKPINQEHKTIEQRAQDFRILLDQTFPTENKLRLDDFFKYWAEHSIGAKKMRWEKETAFDLSRRLATWKSREKDGVYNEQPKKQMVY